MNLGRSCLSALALAWVAACGSSPDERATSGSTVGDEANSQGAGGSTATAGNREGSSATAGNESTGGGSANHAGAGGATSTSPDAATAVVVTAVASEAHGACEELDAAIEETWDTSAEVSISLGDDATTASGPNVTVEGNLVTITGPGNYRMSGTLGHGRVVVASTATGVVRLILDNAHVASSQDSALHVASATRTIVVLADGTSNSLTDSATYSGTTEANAALFSQDDLAIVGTGSLRVKGSYKDGITSKDQLVIRNGVIAVDAVDDGIRGKDCLLVRNGTFDVRSGGDGIKADNDSDATLGYLSLKGGSFTVAAGGDAIAASTAAYITDGKFRLTAGGGSGQVLATDLSAKGIKGQAGVVVDGGDFEIDSADDAVHSGGVVYLSGGTLRIASGDDGIHSDGSVTLRGSTVDITKSYEGIEGQTIDIEEGTIHVVASDDGLNASDGSGTGGAAPDGGATQGGMAAGTPTPGGAMNPFAMDGGMRNPGAAGADPMRAGASDSGTMPGATTGGSASNSLLLTIRGGRLVVDAYGDGLDSNGSIIMTGGVVLVSGPVNDGNGPLDIGDGAGYEFRVSGGLLVAAGSAGMAIAPSSTSTQHSVFLTTQASSMGAMGGGSLGTPGAATQGAAIGATAGTLMHIESANGATLLTYAPPKQFASLVFSSPLLVDGSYGVYAGGSATGTITDSLYEGGTYQSGTAKGTFAIGSSSTVTTATWSM